MTRKTYIAIPVAPVLLGNSRIPAACCELHPHVTLHHLGAGLTDEKLEAVHQLVHNACAGQGPIRAELTGIGTFVHAHQPKVQGRYPQTPVVLVNSRTISKLWARLDYFLAGIGIKISEKYGFIPHVTLTSLKGDDGTPRWMADFEPRPILLSEIQVVTKDKTKQYEHRERIALKEQSTKPPTTEETLNRFGGAMAAIAPHDRLDTSDTE